MQNNVSFAPQFISPTDRGKRAIICLLIGIVINATSILLGIILIALQPQAAHSSPNSIIAVIITNANWLQDFSQFLDSVLLYITAVFFLMWLHRAYSNLTPLRAQHQSYTPGWAVGWWFIPIASIYVPYKVVKEAWIQSDPMIYEESEYWHRSHISTLFLCWWFLWIFSGLVGMAYAFYARAATETSEFQAFTKAMMITKLFNIGAAFLCIKIVSGINKRQEARFQKMAV